MATDVKFEDSNAAGKICEDKVVEYLINKLWATDIKRAPNKYFPYRDIKATINWVEVKYEVKSDRASERHHNVYLEYKTSKWKPSGYLWTSADYFIIYSDRKWRQQEVQELRKRINAFPEKEHRRGGNNNNTRARVVNVKYLPLLFDQIEDIEALPPYVKEETEVQECVGG